EIPVGPAELARPLVAEERDIDLGDLLVPELDVADAPAAVLSGACGAAQKRADVFGRDRRVSFGEYAGPGRPDGGDVADREHARERRLQRQRVDRDPAVDCQPGFN